MLEAVTWPLADLTDALTSILLATKNYLLIFAGFSLVIFFHELGHFIAAKWCDIRVEKFAIGFGTPIFSYRRGMGFRWGSNREEFQRRVLEHAAAKDPSYRAAEEETVRDAELAAAARELKLGETEYCFNVLPLGGYVKMLGQEDFAVDKSGELRVREDPRAFTHKPVGQRMVVVSAGVVMNLVFAALVFMLVFMIGLKLPPAEVGFVLPESPAERAGLRPGDKVVAINGQGVSDFNDVAPAVMLADPSEPSTVKVERADAAGGPPTVMTLEVQPERNWDENKLQIGIAPPFTNRVNVVLPDPALKAEEQVRVGDVIEAVNGKDLRGWQIFFAIAELRGDWADLTVRRTTPDGKEKTAQVKRRAFLAFRPTAESGNEPGHLLGLVPRREVVLVEAGGPAEQAGFKAGDVIIKWGSEIAPTPAEMANSIRKNAEQDIRVAVLRSSAEGKAEAITLQFRPRLTGLFKSGPPRMGMDIGGQEHDRVVVADVVTDLEGDSKTAAAGLKGTMPRGSLITKVNDQPIRTWGDLTSRFLKLAGQDVRLTWSYEGQPEQSASIHVPQTLGTTFDLPPGNRITKIDGVSSVEQLKNGVPVTLGAGTWRGAREILKTRIGKTIEVEYRDFLDTTPKVARLTVTPETLDTWVQRLHYQVLENMMTELVLTTVQEHNPAKAMLIGVRKTYYFIEQVYMMMQRMIITRTVGFEQVSGPVGIVKIGSDIAGEGTVHLLYFLALISANLAVINFLPLPIVDGGLLMFLIIEKIKGSPISIKVQMATQVIGLVLIVGVFIYVTFQDVQRLFG